MIGDCRYYATTGFCLTALHHYFTTDTHSETLFLMRRVCVVQLKLKWNSLSWKKKKRWTGCHPMVKRVPLLTADPTGPWDTALTMTPPRCPPTTNHGTTWRPQSVTLKIWKMDSKNMKESTSFLSQYIQSPVT